MAYAYAYPQMTGYVAPPTAMYYYQPQQPVYLQHHNPQFVQYLQQHPNQQLVNDSATNIQKLARGFTERAARQVTPPKTGSVVVQVHGATGIHNAQCCFTQSPYAMITYGSISHKCPPDSGGGRYPSFEKGDKSAPAAFKFAADVTHVKVELLNSNLFCDDSLGYAMIPVEDLWRDVSVPAEPQDYPLVGKHGKGTVSVTAFYAPPLHITIHRCKDLVDVQAVGKQDPFVEITVPGALGRQQQRTSTCRDGHTAPKWEGAAATFTFLLRHQWHLQRPRTEEEKDDEEARPKGPGMTFQVVNDNHLKNANIAYVRVPWELTLKTWLRGPVWTEMTRGSPKGKKAESGGFIAWSVSGGPTVREEEERHQDAFQPQQHGMMPMPSGPVPQYQMHPSQQMQQQGAAPLVQPGVHMSSSQSYN